MLPLAQAISRVVREAGREEEPRQGAHEVLDRQAGDRRIQDGWSKRNASGCRPTPAGRARSSLALEQLCDEPLKPPFATRRGLQPGAAVRRVARTERASAAPRRLLDGGHLFAPRRYHLAAGAAAGRSLLGSMSRTRCAPRSTRTCSCSGFLTGTCRPCSPIWPRSASAETGAGRLKDVVACPGTDSCKLGITASRGLASHLRKEFGNGIERDRASLRSQDQDQRLL